MQTRILGRFFSKSSISEASNIRQTSKLYSQIAEMSIYKIREYGDDRMTFSNFSRRSQKIVKHRSPKMGSFEKHLKSMKIGQNSKKIDFFKMSQLFTPTMINEKTQLGQVVSLPKGLGLYFYAEMKNRFLTPKYSQTVIDLDFYTDFTQEMVIEVNF